MTCCVVVVGISLPCPEKGDITFLCEIFNMPIFHLTSAKAVDELLNAQVNL